MTGFVRRVVSPMPGEIQNLKEEEYIGDDDKTFSCPGCILFSVLNRTRTLVRSRRD